MELAYSEAFIEQALVKSYSRGGRTVKSVAEELNINYHTLKNWMRKKSVHKDSGLANKEKRPQDWSAAEQLTALQESHALSGEALSTWCRERGLFAHHLSAWKTAFCTDGKAAPSSRDSAASPGAKFRRTVVAGGRSRFRPSSMRRTAE